MSLTRCLLASDMFFWPQRNNDVLFMVFQWNIGERAKGQARERRHVERHRDGGKRLRDRDRVGERHVVQHGDDGHGDRRSRRADHHHCVRQHTGDNERGAVPAAAVRAEYIHRVAGRGRSDGGHRCAAAERGVQRDGRVAVRRSSVQAVVDVRRDVLHRIHTEPVRDRAGSVPGHHAADRVRAEAYRVPRHVDSGAGVAGQRGHQLAAADRLERLAARVRRAHAVHAHHAPRLRHLLVHGIVLHTVAGHERHVPEDLRGHSPTVEAPRASGTAKQLPATGRTATAPAATARAPEPGRPRIVRADQRRRRRQVGGHRRRFGQQQRRGGRGQQHGKHCGGRETGVRRRRRREARQPDRQTRQPVAGTQAAHIPVQGTESGQNAGCHHGRVRR